tara:strand:- start:314 stop:769 length:456 start_codon:yes stop_codon:yes gene_type:complete
MDPKAQAINWAPPLEGQDATAAVEWLLQFATRHQASDVHLHMDREGCRVQFRLDGVLTNVGTLPIEAAKLVLGRVKYLAKLKTYVESLPQDGRIAADEVGLGSDVRVSTYPTVTGEKPKAARFKNARTRGECCQCKESKQVTSAAWFVLEY